MIYIAIVSTIYTLLYIFLIFALKYAFNNKKINKNNVNIKSILLILIMTIFSLIIVNIIKDPYLSNRFQHAISGGFLAFSIIFFAFKDTKIKINTLQFLILSTLIVTFLGVANEILEFVLQTYTNLIFNNSVNDTWLDLLSNTFGIILASTIYGIIFYKINEKKTHIKN